MLNIPKIKIYPQNNPSTIKFTHKNNASVDMPFCQENNYPKIIYLKKDKKDIDLIKQNKFETFSKSIEGKKRLELSVPQIMHTTNNIASDIFNKLKLPQNARPALIILEGMQQRASYNPEYNELYINPIYYINGIDEFEHMLSHEAVHCQMNYIRSSIPENDKKRIIQELMIENILNGEQKFIAFDNKTLIVYPRLPVDFRKDFAEFTKKFLFTKDPDFIKNLSLFFTSEADFKVTEENTMFLNNLKDLINSSPYLQELSDNKVKLLRTLLKYSISIMYRYNEYLNSSANNADELKSPNISKAKAETAMREYIETKEASYAPFLKYPNDIDLYLYYFCPEEIKAETFANIYLIDTLNKKLDNNDMDTATKIYYSKCRQNAIKQLRYLSTGKKFYDTYKKFQQSKNDQNLKNQLIEILCELKGIEFEKNPQYYNIIAQ